MSSNDVAIRVENLSKCYQIYDKPVDRLKQFILPRLERLLGLKSKQYYREFWALKDVSFELKKGQTLGIIGRNGSGKSTLLQLICGMLNSTTGSVYTNGRVAAILELGSGFNPEFTGRENVYLNGRLYGLTTHEMDQRYQQIIEFADIGDFIDQPVKTYSSGMLVRLAFAVIAHVDADILVIDEALAVGDAYFNQKCLRFINRFKVSGGTILFVSHDIGSVVSLCDLGILLQNKSDRTFYFLGLAEDISKKYLEDFYERSETNNVERLAINSAAETIDQNLETYSSLPPSHSQFIVSPFNQDASRFGCGALRIVGCGFYDDNFELLHTVQGGQKVTFKVFVEVNHQVRQAAFGLMFKDKCGQKIFTESSSNRLESLHLNSGACLEVSFKFFMPDLQIGDFMIDVAVAEGLGNNHIQHDWIYDAIKLECIKTPLAHGVAGFHMSEIFVSVKSAF